MRRLLLLLILAIAAASEPALAKLGMSKTKVVLPRVKPPENPLRAETVFLDVLSASSEVTGSHVTLVRGRIEDALRSSGLYRTVDRPREADAAIKVTLDALRAEVRDEVRMETKRVKIGEREEWDEKKKKNVTKDVYGDRQVPVSWRVADGSLSATVETTGVEGSRTTDAGGSYHDQFKMDGEIPPEASTEESLRRYLVEKSGDRAAAAVTFSPDPVEALLAVTGDLKEGNRLAEQGLFEQALEEWNKRTYRGDAEAARLHNVAVGYEALAYKLPPYTPEHRGQLEQARGFYQKALVLDPDEKYFREPPPRVERSLQYAASASLFMSQLDQFREEKRDRERRPPKREPVGSAFQGASGSGAALRNGSFESDLAAWVVAGRGTVVEERGRGKVLEAVPGAAASVALKQTVSLGLEAKAGATLSLDYRVASGEARIRAHIAYADAAGKPHSSTLEVTGGEGPGEWSSWSGDIGALRPRPAQVKEIKLVVNGGTALLDNVALASR